MGFLNNFEERNAEDQLIDGMLFYISKFMRKRVTKTLVDNKMKEAVRRDILKEWTESPTWTELEAFGSSESFQLD